MNLDFSAFFYFIFIPANVSVVVSAAVWYLSSSLLVTIIAGVISFLATLILPALAAYYLMSSPNAQHKEIEQQ
jgi:putative effector of murein hydrolase LrgA (UPF0299 family)